MERVLKVRLVRACEMVVSRKIYRLGDELELPEELATMYAARGDVELLDEPGDQAAPVEVVAEAPAKRSRAKK